MLGQQLGQLRLCGRLAAGDRVIEQQQHLIEHVDRGLRQQGQQDQVTTFRFPPRQGLTRQPPTHPDQEAPALGRQHRQIHGVSVQAAQERQLGHLGLHCGRAHARWSGTQPGQRRFAQVGVDRQQCVQIGAAIRIEQVRHAGPGLCPRPGSCGGDTLKQMHHTRPHRLPRGQVLAACPNSSFGESCSIARANRNSSSSFHPEVSIKRHPLYSWSACK